VAAGPFVFDRAEATGVSVNRGERTAEAAVRRRPAAAGGLAVALVMAAAVLAPEGFGVVDEPGPEVFAVPELPAAADYLAVAFVILMLLNFVIARVIAGRAGVLRPRSRGPSARALLGLAVALLVITRLPDIGDGLLGGDEGTQQIETQADPRDPGEAAIRTSSVLGWILMSGLIVLLAGAGALSFWLLRLGDEAGTAGDGSDVLEKLSLGIADLQSIEDPRRAVIACYARMQILAGDRRIGHRLSDTPFELLDRIARGRPELEPSVHRLTLLFERAKFSPHTVDEVMRSDALEALEEIRTQMGAVT
jgi:hypothetical protein